jgi:hypothetical protein
MASDRDTQVIETLRVLFADPSLSLTDFEFSDFGEATVATPAAGVRSGFYLVYGKRAVLVNLAYQSLDDAYAEVRRVKPANPKPIRVTPVLPYSLFENPG